MSVSGVVPGGTSGGMEDILRWLSDPELVQRRSVEVEALEERARAASLLLNSAETIPDQLARALADREKAKQDLDSVNARAAAILERANQAAAALMQDASFNDNFSTTLRTETEAAMAKLVSETQKAVLAERATMRAERAQLDADKASTVSAQAKLVEAQTKLAADEQTLAAARISIDRRLNRMTEVWGGV